jgi:hydrogenase nickel incorporation protein HypB
MLLEVLPLLDLDRIDLLLIENIGNMHYTARFRLGEHRRVACVSTSGGQWMIDKYPTSFATSDLNLITKAGLAEYVDFNIPQAVCRLHKLNTGARVLVTDAASGDGVDVFCRYLCRESDGAIRRS